MCQHVYCAFEKKKHLLKLKSPLRDKYFYVLSTSTAPLNPLIGVRLSRAVRAERGHLFFPFFSPFRFFVANAKMSDLRHGRSVSFDKSVVWAFLLKPFNRELADWSVKNGWLPLPQIKLVGHQKRPKFWSKVFRSDIMLGYWADSSLFFWSFGGISTNG